MVKNLPVNARDPRVAGSIPGSGIFPRGGNDTPLQSSCLGNILGKEIWQATIHGVAKSGHY